jgi:hypothetical protein
MNPKIYKKPCFCVDCDNYYIGYGNDVKYIVDNIDWICIRNFEKTFRLDEEHNYPYYKCNNKEISILEFIFKFSINDNIYVFKNNNKNDLRDSNVICYPKIYSQIIDQYKITNYIQGHFSTLGQAAYKIKNCIWEVNENENKYLLMYCENDTICKLCEESYSKILAYETTINKKLTWYKCENGYIQTHDPIEKKTYYIHQIITGCHGNGKGTKNISVDHIDRNPLNNSWENLRVATREEQEQNSKGIASGTKRARKTSAKDLPEGITQEMMARYVCYYHEFLNPEETRSREYFKIEKHPKLDKIWIGTKSNKVSIQEKLLQVNKVVVDLECDIYPEKQKIGLPKYISLVTIREKPHLVYDQKTNDGRMCIKMVLPEEYDLHSQLEILNDKIKEKYKDHVITM